MIPAIYVNVLLELFQQGLILTLYLDDTSYVCECPIGTTPTGVNLNDPSSTDTACTGVNI